MKTYKKSNYAFFVKKEDGTYVIYSSLTGFILKVYDKKHVKTINEIIKKNLVDEQDDELFNLLIKKKVLIPKEDNDLLYAKTLYEEAIVKSKSLEVMIIVTKNCNFRCVYCGQNHETDKNINTGQLNNILNIIELMIIEKRYTDLKISFFGGEPLLEYNKIINFLEKIKELSLKHHFTFNAGMSTNGYLLTTSRLKKLCNLNCNSYQISIDGMNEIHDKKRPLTNGNPTWKVIMNNIENIIKTNYDFKIVLRTNYNYEVAESLIEFYDFYKNKIDDKRIVMYFENIKNHGNENTPEVVSEYESMCIDLELANILKNKNIYCVNAIDRLMPCGIICYAAKPNFYIFDIDGNIKKCSFDENFDENIIGKFNDKNSFEIDSTKYMKWAYNDYQFSKKCGICKLLPLCFGKKCPKNYSIYGYSESCNLDLLYNQIEGILKNYY